MRVSSRLLSGYTVYTSRFLLLVLCRRVYSHPGYLVVMNKLMVASSALQICII
jgi:hypothetical protein